MLKIHEIYLDSELGFSVKYQVETEKDVIALATVLHGLVGSVNKVLNQNLDQNDFLTPEKAYMETVESNINFFPEIVRNVSYNIDGLCAHMLIFGAENEEDFKRIGAAQKKALS